MKWILFVISILFQDCSQNYIQTWILRVGVCPLSNFANSSANRQNLIQTQLNSSTWIAKPFKIQRKSPCTKIWLISHFNWSLLLYFFTKKFTWENAGECFFQSRVILATQFKALGVIWSCNTPFRSTQLNSKPTKEKKTHHQWTAIPEIPNNMYHAISYNTIAIPCNTHSPHPP